MTDLATLTAILYAARWQRRVPESDAEKRRTIADALADATTDRGRRLDRDRFPGHAARAGATAAVAGHNRAYRGREGNPSPGLIRALAATAGPEAV